MRTNTVVQLSAPARQFPVQVVADVTVFQLAFVPVLCFEGGDARVTFGLESGDRRGILWGRFECGQGAARS